MRTCQNCKFFLGKSRCKAFREIPEEFLIADNPHKINISGDKGFRYKPNREQEKVEKEFGIVESDQDLDLEVGAKKEDATMIIGKFEKYPGPDGRIETTAQAKIHCPSCRHILEEYESDGLTCNNDECDLSSSIFKKPTVSIFLERKKYT